MKRQNNKVIVWLRVCVLAMFYPAFLWRCATVMNLEGGPIDTLPPVIVSMAKLYMVVRKHEFSSGKRYRNRLYIPKILGTTDRSVKHSVICERQQSVHFLEI